MTSAFFCFCFYFDSPPTSTYKSICTWLRGQTTAKEQQAAPLKTSAFNALNCSIPVAKCRPFLLVFFFFSFVESQTQWNLRRTELGEDEVAGGRVGGGLNYRTKPRRPHLNFLLSPSPLLPTFNMFSCHWRSLFLILHKRSEGVQRNLGRAG